MQEKFQSPFEGPNLSGDDLNYHVIVTDHPYMAELGLSAFTTGQLYEWMKKTSKGEYNNLKIFGENYTEKNIPPEELTNPLLNKVKDHFPIFQRVAQRILGLEKYESNGKKFDMFIFDAWRFFDEGTGDYVKYINTLMPNSTWKYKTYSYNSLNFSEFQQKVVRIPVFENAPTYPNNYLQIDLTGQNNLDNYISNLIEMNNYVRYRAMSTPKISWKDIDKVRSEFILDIKSSFQKCVEWSGIVPFTLNIGTKTTGEGSTGNGCKKEELVSFKLFLFDESLPKENARKITMNELVYVAPKIDSYGRVGNKENGELTAVSRDIKPKDSTAGKLDLQWNEFEGKWQSGTPQVLAILKTTIPAATLPTLEQIATEDTKSLLAKNVIPTGLAIPLNTQNGNPYQLGPDYKLAKDCRNNNNEKFEVTVYNRVPRAWPSGEIVILNKIDGIWQPSSYGEPKEEIDLNIGVDGKWEFMYLMAHADTYFRNSSSESVTFFQFEEGIRALYYGNNSEDPLNGSSTYENAIKYAQVTNDYFQVTSWDFMGPNIGGLRPEGNALACTQYYTNPKGEELPVPYVPGNTSNPFFGCVFPDGYDMGTKWLDYRDGNHDILFQYSNYEYLEYMGQINSDINLFQNNNQNLSDGAAGGMFILDNSRVAHLPADIALNASPSGKNGSTLKPIYPLKYLSSLHHISNSTKAFKFNIDKWFFNSDQKRNGVWMTYGLNEKNESNNKYNSAFDFTPINPGRLTFRPLKLETYASFEFNESDAWDVDMLKPTENPKNIAWWFSPNKGAIPAEATKERGTFGCRDWAIMKDKRSPIATKAFERNLDNNFPITRYTGDPPASLATKYNDIYGYRGLRYNVDLPDSGKLPKHVDDVESDPNAIGTFFCKDPLWNKKWMHGNAGSDASKYEEFRQWIEARGSTFQKWLDKVNQARPAGAVGIIGAQCTVTAKEAIVIQCDDYVGANFYQLRSGFYPSAGSKGGSNYNSLNTTSLHARIFHAWPKDLTIYDPRFFAVFHFNPGVGIIDDENKNPKYDWYNAGQLWEEELPGSIDINYPDGWYQVERSESEVDFRIPTSSQVDGVGKSLPISVGTIINSNTARAKNHCNINRIRRGKLLPYIASLNDIGIGWEAKIKNGYFKSDPDDYFYPKEYDYVALWPGNGYSVNDRFIVTGGDGYGVILQPILGDLTIPRPNGSQEIISQGIVGFKPTLGQLGLPLNGTSPGKEFSASDFLPSEQNLITLLTNVPNSPAQLKNWTTNEIVTPKLKIVPSGKVQGTGFIGYVLRGQVFKRENLDTKPFEVVSNKKLTETKEYPLKGQDLIEMEPGSQETVITLNDKNKNTNKTYGLQNKYDIFLHFHNDISHTYSYFGQGNPSYGGGVPRSYEQHVTIDIEPV